MSAAELLAKLEARRAYGFRNPANQRRPHRLHPRHPATVGPHRQHNKRKYNHG